MVQNLQHPEDSSRIDNFILIGCWVLDIEINNVKQQVQNDAVLRVKECLEDKHEELFI
jgi:hypothetical protein